MMLVFTYQITDMNRFIKPDISARVNNRIRKSVSESVYIYSYKIVRN